MYPRLLDCVVIIIWVDDGRRRVHDEFVIDGMRRKKLLADAAIVDKGGCCRLLRISQSQLLCCQSSLSLFLERVVGSLLRLLLFPLFGCLQSVQ